MAKIRVKSVYEKREKADGVRVLVTRLWPRGIPKTAVDTWLPWLGPSAKLLADFKAGRTSRENYVGEYVTGLGDMRAQLLLAGLQALVGSGRTITLLCVCPGARPCHRHLLQKIVKGRLLGEAWPLRELLKANLFEALDARIQKAKEEERDD